MVQNCQTRTLRSRLRSQLEEMFPQLAHPNNYLLLYKHGTIMTKKPQLTNSKQSSRPLESFSPQMVQLLVRIASNPSLAPVDINLPDAKVAFRLKMDLNKLRADLKNGHHLDPHVRKQLHGLKFHHEKNSATLTIDHYDSAYIESLDEVLEKIGGAELEVPDLSDIDIEEGPNE